MTVSCVRMIRRIRTLGHHRILVGDTWILRHHWISRIIRMSNGFTRSIVHVLHRIPGHWNMLGFIRSSAALLAALVQVTTGTHEATDHGGYSSHKEQDG